MGGRDHEWKILYYKPKVISDLSLDSYTYENFICQKKQDRMTCYGGRKIKITSAYYGRKQAFKCGFVLDTNCVAEGSEEKVTYNSCAIARSRQDRRPFVTRSFVTRSFVTRSFVTRSFLLVRWRAARGLYRYTVTYFIDRDEGRIPFPRNWLSRQLVVWCTVSLLHSRSLGRPFMTSPTHPSHEYS